MRRDWLDDLADELTRETPRENWDRYIRWCLAHGRFNNGAGPDPGERPELSPEARAQFSFTDMVRESLARDGQN